MYGKHFASMYNGSMVGSGLAVFAVWGYVIGHAVAGQVELNPIVMGTVLGCDPGHVESAIERLCSADPKSRSKAEDGRRLAREGEFAYRVVNHDKYRQIKNEIDRREYNRIKQQEHRARAKQADDLEAMRLARGAIRQRKGEP